MSIRQGNNLIAGTPDITGKANTDADNFTATGKTTITEYAMPSDSWVDLTVGANGATYTAPANGYYGFRNNAQTYLSIKNLSSTVVENEQMAVWLPINSSSGFLPVKKGQTIQLNYSANSFVYFRFIYAEGEI